MSRPDPTAFRRRAPRGASSLLALCVVALAGFGGPLRADADEDARAARAPKEAVVERDVPQRVDDLQSMDVDVVPMNDFVHRIEGEGAFFLVNTSEGAVLIDTGTLYPMFPNLYTVRGEKYRDPLDDIDALDRVLALRPRTIAHSHFRKAEGEACSQASVKRMRDAVQYMGDELVKEMNGGKTVWGLMRDIELSPELALSQGHGHYGEIGLLEADLRASRGALEGAPPGSTR